MMERRAEPPRIRSRWLRIVQRTRRVRGVVDRTIRRRGSRYLPNRTVIGVEARRAR